MSEATPSTLYAVAAEEMRRLIGVYLDLTEQTTNFARLQPKHLQEEDARRILLSGIGSTLDPAVISAADAVAEWERRQAIPFDIETSVTTGVYIRLRKAGEDLFDAFLQSTSNFTNFDPEFIAANPAFLPILQHVGGLFSKAELKRRIGSVNDTHISIQAARRLAEYLKTRVDPSSIRKGEVLGRLDSTLEGIVRDLVGRILLESVVANALERQALPFFREEQYQSLPGVVYDFRADFVLPDPEQPKVFIEVRKSSTRHASLYAKDKMFSAINWKGYHKELLGVLIVDGPWTGATLQVMARVFDYVVPVGRSADLAKTVAAYLAGDKSKLKWLIEFQISENPLAKSES